MGTEGRLTCRPLILPAVCAWGRKEFRSVHYLFEDADGNPVPAGASPVNSRINALKLERVFREGRWVVLEGSYRVLVWFEYSVGSQPEVALSDGVFPFRLEVPVEQPGGGCSPPGGEPTRISVTTTRLHPVATCVEPTPPEEQHQGYPPRRVKVVVEKEFFVMERGESVVCLPCCPPGECPYLTGAAGGGSGQEGG